jgi:hypothetical protein
MEPEHNQVMREELKAIGINFKKGKWTMSGKPIYFNNESNTFYPQGKKALLCKAKHVKFKEFNDFGKNFIEELITFVR